MAHSSGTGNIQNILSYQKARKPSKVTGQISHWTNSLLRPYVWVDKKSNNYGLKHINSVKIHDCIILNNNSGDDNETSQWSPLEDAVEPAYSEGKESSIHFSRLSWVTK